MTGGQITVRELVKNYYRETGASPDLRTISEIAGMTRRQLYDLFPDGLIKSLYVATGIPIPRGCQ
jgi:sulfur relay (sulfurtransferase) DsrC/TusE family protein